mmetsp:Transcript_105827/g.294538  ORF Transcript_105827/g.294538 Transcript_105827/m.294538 type:complete len:266 (+) Transcript_105827:55-852(+)
MAKVEAIYIAPKSAAPMESLTEATLVAGIGIEGDRYALRKGTYSAKFFGEPGANVTLVSADGVEAKVAETGLEPFESLGALRRNLVVRGLTAEAVNEMVGHEVKVGNVCLFVHRRCVPCKYREAQTNRPGLMNKLWDVCGVNCEVLDSGEVHVGDAVAVLPNTHQLKRANPGFKPAGFFTRPADRSMAEHRSMIIPPLVAAVMCLVDPEGFQRVEDGYNSAGQHFWSPQAYRAGVLAKKLRAPVAVAAVGAVLAVMVAVVQKLRK